MIINCRPSDPNKFLAFWIKRRYLPGYGFRDELKSKSFNTFADANGFTISLQKRGVLTYPVERL